MLDKIARPIPNSEPDEIPFHLYDDWAQMDTWEGEVPDDLKIDPLSDEHRNYPSSGVEDQFTSEFLKALEEDAAVVVRNVNPWQALQIWRKRNRRG